MTANTRITNKKAAQAFAQLLKDGWIEGDAIQRLRMLGYSKYIITLLVA